MTDDTCHICGAPAMASKGSPASCRVCYELEYESVSPFSRVSNDTLQRRHRKRLSHFRAIDPSDLFAARRHEITRELA